MLTASALIGSIIFPLGPERSWLNTLLIGLEKNLLN